MRIQWGSQLHPIFNNVLGAEEPKLNFLLREDIMYHKLRLPRGTAHGEHSVHERQAARMQNRCVGTLVERQIEPSKLGSKPRWRGRAQKEITANDRHDELLSSARKGADGTDLSGLTHWSLQV